MEFSLVIRFFVGNQPILSISLSSRVDDLVSCAKNKQVSGKSQERLRVFAALLISLFNAQCNLEHLY